jgi:hypothetical protein
MSSPEFRLKELLNKAKKQKRIDNSFVKNVMANTRELLEARQEQQNYQIVNLYCNWSLHNKISGSMRAVQALVVITQKLMDTIGNGKPVEDFLNYLSCDSFGVDVLRQELIKLYINNNLKTFLFVPDANWFIFSSLLLYELEGKPLSFPDNTDEPLVPTDKDLLKKAKKIYLEMHCPQNSTWSGLGLVKKAWITTDIDPWDERPGQLRKPVFHCNIQVFDGPTFKIAMNGVVPLPVDDDYQISLPKT